MIIDTIYNEDCLDTMNSMPDGLVDLTVTSPPYDSMRLYGAGSTFDFEATANLLYRITKDGGTVVWIVGDQVKNHNETGTSMRQGLYFRDKVGFNLFDTMIYSKPPRPVGSSPIGYFQTFEFMFVLTKGKPETINLIKDRKNKSYNKPEVNNYRQKKDNKQNRTRTFMPYKYSKRTNIWYYPSGSNHTTTDKIAFTHPAVMAERLAQDHILSWSNEGDLVYDPFVGSGTTAKMALINNRHYIGSEINPKYHKLCQKRLAPYIKQKRLV